MLCPVCETEMLVLEFELVEIDYCDACGGVWLDSGELELIGERAGGLQEGLAVALKTQVAETSTEGGKRRCPVCRKGMGRVSTPGDTPIELDRCPAEHGLWFDQGELAAVVGGADADEDNALVRFFAKLGTYPEEEQGSEEKGGD